jgi:DNA-binding transcriptional regulator YiaG
VTFTETLRTKLGLTQQAFASLLGLSFTAVNRWENRKAPPAGLGEVLLKLLDGALKCRKPEEVVRALRATDGSSVQIVRALVKLEQQDTE